MRAYPVVAAPYSEPLVPLDAPTLNPDPAFSLRLSAEVPPLAPGALPIADLLDGLRSVPESRAKGRVLHLLGDVLLTALFATIADCDEFISMGIFAQTQLGWLRQYVPLILGSPSHDTFGNVSMKIKPAVLLAIRAWLRRYASGSPAF